MLPPPVTAVLTLVCIWLGLGSVEGKCAGKWAIHACGGGNGKRSDGGAAFDQAPSYAALPSSSNNPPKPGVLKQVLLSMQRADDMALLPEVGDAMADAVRDAAMRNAASEEEYFAGSRGGYVPVADMDDEYQQDDADEIRRREDERQVRNLWHKLVTSLKARAAGKR